MTNNTATSAATERGAQVIKLATRIMAAGIARGWSDALAQAERQVSR